jgi:hypothetical protein
MLVRKFKLLVLDMTYSNIHDLPVLVETRCVSQRKQNASGGPREFVTQWVS